MHIPELKKSSNTVMDNAATAPVRIAVIQLPSISAKKSPCRIIQQNITNQCRLTFRKTRNDLNPKTSTRRQIRWHRIKKRLRFYCHTNFMSKQLSYFILNAVSTHFTQSAGDMERFRIVSKSIIFVAIFFNNYNSFNASIKRWLSKIERNCYSYIFAISEGLLRSTVFY